MRPKGAPVRVGFLGCGTIEGTAARILLDLARELEERAGAPIALARIAVRDAQKPRSVDLPPELYTTDAVSVVEDPSIDIVVEAMGGLEPARELVLRALRSGKHVVTANKELLSTVGPELTAAAVEAGVDLVFEASVAGGIPIVRGIKESLAGDRVRRVMGIVNGTTNFVLTRMSERGESFSEALSEARRLGYAESDPSADVDGHDAAAKLAILASLAFNARVAASDVHREGIGSVGRDDIVAAHDLGYEIKLIAVAEVDHDGAVSARVHPSMLPRTHPLASVRDVFNAVFVEGEQVGELMFLGRGAGGGPTGSAVVGDVVEVAHNIVSGGRTSPLVARERTTITPIEETRARYYIVLSVRDEPGVLAEVASAFAHHGISISSVRQEGFGDEATLILITHTGAERHHRATLADLAALEVVKSVESTMRVLGTEEG